jgi:hypothetical protein
LCYQPAKLLWRDIKGSDGVYGLQGMKMAGVKNLVMSLWKVPMMKQLVFMKNSICKFLLGLSIDQAFYKHKTHCRA